MYLVRDREVSPEEKLANEFKAQKQFFARIDILMRFVSEADTENELFTDMFTYFTQYLKPYSTESEGAYSSVTEQVIASFLLIRRIAAENPVIFPDFAKNYQFETLFKRIENPREMYTLLKDTKNTFLKTDFLACVKMLPNWVELYLELFPTVLRGEMLATLINKGNEARVKQLAGSCFENYRDFRDAAIYFFKECQQESWFAECGISYEKQLITMIHILDLTFREISNHVETTENRKINRQVQTLLFGKKENLNESQLLKYMLENNEDTVTRLYTLIDDVKDIDPAIKMNMRNRILEKYPEFKFHGTEEKTSAPQGLIVTAKMYDVKKQQLERITTVEIPANSKEVGEALALGDLRENAEYKAAKERQGQLANQATRLQDEINRAQIFDPTTVTTVRVSFGTKVTLNNNITGETEEYTILGPWESDPDNSIISYLSPLGIHIFNSKEGDTLSFVINDLSFNYTVNRIAAVKF